MKFFKSINEELSFDTPSELFVDVDGCEVPSSIRELLFGHSLGEASLARKENLEAHLHAKAGELIKKYSLYIENLRELMNWVAPTAWEQWMEQIRKQEEKLKNKKKSSEPLD